MSDGVAEMEYAIHSLRARPIYLAETCDLTFQTYYTAKPA